MPTFCRHNRLLQRCPICAREQDVELTPLISPSAPRTSLGEGERPRRGSAGTASGRPSQGGRRGGRGASGASSTSVRVRRLERGADDGYRSGLAPGLRASSEAERLAEELAFATGRLRVLAAQPPGLYAEVAGPGEREERMWLAFLIAYLCPLDEDDPFSAIRGARTSWGGAEQPGGGAEQPGGGAEQPGGGAGQANLGSVATGPRAARDPRRPLHTLEAYRAWARRSGSQAAAFTGDIAWSPERRFGRVFERLALPGLHRDARFDLLVTLGRLGVVELSPGQLMLGGAGEVTVAAKRVFGIGDPLLLEARAAAFASACEVPLAALDLGLYNWERGERAHLGLAPGTPPDAQALDAVRAGLGL
jgi:hypothetical protein